MVEKHLIRTVGVAAIMLLIGSGALVSPSSAQSLTDRFKSLFGGKSDEPAQQAPVVSAGPEPEVNCPPVTIRAGASTYVVAAPGKQAVGNDVRFQASITKTARDCTRAGGEITARIGIQGRVIAGPAGAPTSIEVPLRVAVAMGESENVPFTLVADDVVYPIPPGAVGDSYIFYIGFDPQLASPESKPKAAKKKK